MAVTKRVRYEVLRRDNSTCKYCKSTGGPLTIDHVMPTALGGTDDPSNLVTACRDCNAGKSSAAPDAATVAEVSDDAARWAAAMKLAASRLAANKAEADERLRPWFEAWSAGSRMGWAFRLPADADEVLTKYVAAGMPIEVLVDAARVALRRPNIEDRFRYFQGVANNMLADLQRDAVVFMSAQEVQPEASAPDEDASFGWGNRPWRKGYLTALEHIQQAEGGNPLYRENTQASAYQYGALAMVVDAEAMEWAASA